MRETLIRVFQEKKSNNPGYSLRAFSRQLNLSPAALSQMLSGKRPITAKTLEQVIKHADLDPADTECLFASLKNSNQRQLIDMDALHLMGDWYYFAILSLAETGEFKSEAAWIAKRLNIPVEAAQTALERLARVGMLEPDGEGKLRATGKSFSTHDGIANIMIQKRHRQHLRLAEASLHRDSVEQRDFTSITMAIDPSKIPLAKEMIRKFRNRLCKVLEGGDQKEVYIFCQQLFALSNLNDETGDNT